MENEPHPIRQQKVNLLVERKVEHTGEIRRIEPLARGSVTRIS